MSDLVAVFLVGILIGVLIKLPESIKTFKGGYEEGYERRAYLADLKRKEIS